MVKGILRVLHARIVDRRPPNFVIGGQQDPYMRRWWVIPRNRFINIYLHQVLRPDDDRALHDHPWINLSIILDGGYWEITPGPNDRHQHRWCPPGTITFRRAAAAHRLDLAEDIQGQRIPCWTLFITGPRIREWGWIGRASCQERGCRYG